MNSEEILIPRKITNQLLHYAQLSPEDEICGLIGSLNNIPVSCYPIDNVANHPQRRFLLDPKQQINSMTLMRKQNEDLFAIYHSHPSAPAMPSQTDLNMASYPEALTLIISLNTKGVLEMRGFRLKNNHADEVMLSLIQN